MTGQPHGHGEQAAGQAGPAPKRGAGYWALLRGVPHVVARAGFRGLTYRALAKQAGVTYGLIGYYFGSREALIEEAARLASAEAIAGSEVAPPSGDVHDFAAGLSTVLADEPDAQAFQYELVCEARRSEPLLPPVKEMYERYIGAISSSMRELGIEHSPAMARTIFAALDGLALQQLVYDDPEMTDESVMALREILVALGERSGGEAD